MRSLFRLYLVISLLTLSWLYHIEYMEPVQRAHWPKPPYDRNASPLERHFGIVLMSFTLPLALLFSSFVYCYNQLVGVLAPIIALYITPQMVEDMVRM